MQPETALDSGCDWDTPPSARPTMVRELGGGRSNRSYLLDADGGQLVLRINAAASTLAGINRGHEARIWRAASAAGIAPPLVHADPGGTFLVSAYIENDLPTAPGCDPSLKAKALGVLQATHQLDVDAPAIDYAAHIEAYWRQIEDQRVPIDPGLSQQREPMRLLLQELGAGDAPRVLCHHDPVVENFVGNAEHFYLVDWEYAAHGLQMMDYAALTVEWAIDDSLFTRQTGIEPALLAKAKTLYRYICALWEVTKITA